MTPDLENQAKSELQESSPADEARSPSNSNAEANNNPTIAPGAGANPSSSSLPKTRLGSKRTQATHEHDSSASTYDYTYKYPRDEVYHELDNDARIWLVYNDEADTFDTDMIEEASDSLDILLIFVGLFAGVLTTFVAESAQSLQQDSAAVSASLLQELVQLQRANGNQTLIQSVPQADIASQPSGLNRWINGLWFAALALSLSSALLAVLAKQWLRQYQSFITGTPRERALLRQFRFGGFDRWHVRAIIGFLPTMLHISLLLFMIGLVLFLIPLDTVVASVIGAMTFILLSIYIITNLLPIKRLECPYRTPLTDLVYHLLRLCFGRRFEHRDLKDAQREAVLWGPASDWAMEELEALNWLVKTVTNPSAGRVVLQCFGALQPSKARLIQMQRCTTLESVEIASTSLPGKVKERADRWDFWLWDKLKLAAAEMRPVIPGGDTKSLTQDQKDDLQRSIIADLHSHLLRKERWEEGQGHYWSAIRDNVTFSLSPEDLGLALSIIAYPRLASEKPLVALIESPDGGRPVELRSTNAFSWMVDNYAALELPELPALIWMYLQDHEGWSLKNVQDPDKIPKGFKLMLKAIHPSRPTYFEPPHLPERGPVSLELFMVVQVYYQLTTEEWEALWDKVYVDDHQGSEKY